MIREKLTRCEERKAETASIPYTNVSYKIIYSNMSYKTIESIVDTRKNNVEPCK